MSIINNILKDLEKKQSEFSPLETANVSGPHIRQTQMNWNVLLLVVVVMLIVAVFWQLFVWWENNTVFVASPDSSIAEQEFVQQTSSSLNMPVEPGPIKLTPASVEVNKIIGLQINEADQAFKLEFLLQSKVVAYLKERNESGFIFHMKEIDSEINAPVIRDNRWIRSLQILPVDGGIDIRFETIDRLLVGTSQFSRNEESVWSINLKKELAPVVNRVSKAKPVGQVIKPVTKSEVVQPEKMKSAHVSVENKSSLQSPQETKPEVKLEISSTRKSTESLELQRATELVRKKRWRQAEKVLFELLNLSEDLPARNQLVRLYEASSQSAKLRSTLKESLLRYPAHAYFNTVQARLYFRAGEYRRAIDLLVPQASNEPDQLALIGASYQRLDEYEKSVAFYRASLHLESRQVRNWIGLGISLEHTAEFNEALSAYRAAIKLGNLSPRLSGFVEKRRRALEKVVN